MAQKKDSTGQLKKLLAHELGGAAADWKRGEKKTYAGETRREFSNEKLAIKLDLWERPDGLLCAEKPDGSLLTARLSASGEFNAAAKPSAIDRLMNDIYENRDLNEKLYAEALKEGLVKKFSFRVSNYGEDGGELGKALIATIYPTGKDGTFKCPEFIRGLVPGCEDADGCVETEWGLPDKFDTPAKMVRHLEGLGLTWDRDSQKYDKQLYREIREELGEIAKKPAPKAKK